MVVREAQGGGAKVFDVQSSGMHGLFADYARAVRLHALNMEDAGGAVQTVAYTAFLAVGTLSAVFIALLFLKAKNAFELAVYSGMGIFVAMTLFFFLAGYLYQQLLGKRTDTSYISYVYVVAFSMTYYPPMVFLVLITGRIGYLFSVAMAMVSQYFLRSTMLRGHSFESERDGFLFDLVSFILQWGFVIGASAVFPAISLEK